MIELAELGNFSLLIIEDDGFNQELAAAIFEEYPNITVFKADNGKEAFKVLKKNSIDIILLDLVMPGMNGFETLEILKQSSVYQAIPVIIVTSEENERKRTYKIGANDFISKPYNPTEVKLRVFNNLRIKKFSSLFEKIKNDTEQEENDSDYFDNIKKSLEIADKSQKQLLQKLATIIHHNEDADAQRLGEYAVLLGNIYGLNKREVANLFYAMSIYDIGLLKIPKKAYKDSKIFKSHPQLGWEILNDLEETPLIEMAKVITLYHHENWDGSGYPKGLKAEEIPLYARMATVVDYFDELTSDRCYDNEIMSAKNALDVMQREQGSKLDPSLVDLFAENFQQFKAIKNRVVS